MLLLSLVLLLLFVVCRQYLKAEADHCGSPLSDGMVLNLNAKLYLAREAYSYTATTTAAGTCTDAAFARFAGKMGQAEGNPFTQQPATAAPPAAAAADPTGLTRPTTAKVQSASLQDYYGAGGSGSSSYYEGGPENERTVLVGSALIIKGIVAGMSGPRKEIWDDGVFEYAMSYVGPVDDPTDPPAPIPLVGAQDPVVPWIEDKTYQFTFYRHGSSGGNYYK